MKGGIGFHSLETQFLACKLIDLAKRLKVLTK